MKAAIPAPTVHLNGTSRQELVDQQMEVCRAASALMTALTQASPNMRDYYPQGPDGYRPAAARHVEWMRTIERLRFEAEELAIAIQDQE